MDWNTVLPLFWNDLISELNVQEIFNLLFISKPLNESLLNSSIHWVVQYHLKFGKPEQVPDNWKKDYDQKIMVTEVLDKAFDLVQRKEIYPFTNDPIANDLLTSWVSETYDSPVDFVENNSKQLPAHKKTVFRLYFLDREKSIRFIKDCEDQFPTLIAEGEVSHFQNLLDSVDNLNQWFIVYVILEIENSSICDEEKYPDSLWSLLGDVP